MYDIIYKEKQIRKGRILRCIKKLSNIYKIKTSIHDDTLTLMKKCNVVIVNDVDLYHRYWRDVDYMLWEYIIYVNLYRKGYTNILFSRNTTNDKTLNFIYLYCDLLNKLLK